MTNEIYVGKGKRWEDYDMFQVWDAPEPGYVFSKDCGVIADSEERAREQIQTYLNSKKFKLQKTDWEVNDVKMVPNTSGLSLVERVKVMKELMDVVE